MGKVRRRRIPRKAFSTRSTFVKNYKRKQDSRDTTQVVDLKYPMTEGQGI